MSYFGPPGTWMQFKSRPDNLSLPILEAKRKYLQEQSVFQTFEMQANNNHKMVVLDLLMILIYIK